MERDSGDDHADHNRHGLDEEHGDLRRAGNKKARAG